MSPCPLNPHLCESFKYIHMVTASYTVKAFKPLKDKSPGKKKSNTDNMERCLFTLPSFSPRVPLFSCWELFLDSNTLNDSTWDYKPDAKGSELFDHAHPTAKCSQTFTMCSLVWADISKEDWKTCVIFLLVQVLQSWYSRVVNSE